MTDHVLGSSHFHNVDNVTLFTRVYLSDLSVGAPKFWIYSCEMGDTCCTRELLDGACVSNRFLLISEDLFFVHINSPAAIWLCTFKLISCSRISRALNLPLLPLVIIRLVSMTVQCTEILTFYKAAFITAVVTNQAI